MVLRDSGKALLCKLEDGAELWVPRSVIDDSSEALEDGDDGTLVVQTWFARKTDELSEYVEEE